jgi:hypothetical protein
MGNSFQAVVKVSSTSSTTPPASPSGRKAITRAYDEAAGDAYASTHGMWTTKDKDDYRKLFTDQVMSLGCRYQFGNVREPEGYLGQAWAGVGQPGGQRGRIRRPFRHQSPQEGRAGAGLQRRDRPASGR